MTPAVALLIALTTGLTLYAGYASGRWHYWHREYEALRRYHVKVMREAQVKFIQPDLTGVSEALAEYARVRAEIEQDHGTTCGTPAHRSNVIPVDFRGGDHAA